MTGQHTGKVAIVTGGGSGLGRAITRALAREGARVLIADVNVEMAGDTVALVEATGGAAIVQRADVSDAGDVQSLIDAARKHFGRLDILVNNAGISPKQTPTIEVPDEDFDRMIAINLRGVWLGMKYAIPLMIEGGGGCIVNIASSMALVAQGRGIASYIASKHGVLGLTRALALEYGPQKIRINALCPHGMETPMVEKTKALFTPEAWQQRLWTMNPATGRMNTPEEVADVALYLMSDAAARLHGIALPVDSGFTIQ
jgi:NAD(P)-dependent dehydrogenase (short-subunit alcohol dehydrogenase family)